MSGVTLTTRPRSVESGDNTPNNALEIESSPEAWALVAKCISGDTEAWNTLIKQNEKPVYRFAYYLCRNHDDAADIAGQVFVRLYQNLHTFRREASFSSWMYRIVRNSYMDICVRPPHRRNVSLDSACMNDASKAWINNLVDPGPTPQTACLENQTSRILVRAVRYLPAYQREVVKMYHEEGKSYEQIAEATGLSIGTVRSRLNRARHTLRDRLMPLRDVLTT